MGVSARFGVVSLRPLRIVMLMAWLLYLKTNSQVREGAVAHRKALGRARGEAERARNMSFQFQHSCFRKNSLTNHWLFQFSFDQSLSSQSPTANQLRPHLWSTLTSFSKKNIHTSILPFVLNPVRDGALGHSKRAKSRLRGNLQEFVQSSGDCA